MAHTHTRCTIAKWCSIAILIKCLFLCVCVRCRWIAYSRCRFALHACSLFFIRVIGKSQIFVMFGACVWSSRRIKYFTAVCEVFPASTSIRFGIFDRHYSFLVFATLLQSKVKDDQVLLQLFLFYLFLKRNRNIQNQSIYQYEFAVSS